jgi:hypothetical protein
MYAKLVVGNASINGPRACRDIIRLITSEAPSVDLLEVFDDVSSIIIDDTPAGWTFEGESYNPADSSGLTVPAFGADVNWPVNNTDWQIGCSAPCLNGGLTRKYALFSMSWTSNSNKDSTSNMIYFQLTGATSIAAAPTVADGPIIENEGGRYTWVSAENRTQSDGNSMTCNADTIFHVIANPRHLTIVEESRGLNAIWESNETPVNTFYGNAPFVQYNHCTGTATNITGTTSPTATATEPADFLRGNTFGITDPNDGNFYGVRTLSDDANKGFSLYQNAANIRLNTIDASGSPQYQVGPIFYSLGRYGHPVQFITGIVPIYWTSGNIGSTGDTLIIGGESYTYFNCGANFGIVMQTG